MWINVDSSQIFHFTRSRYRVLYRNLCINCSIFKRSIYQYLYLFFFSKWVKSINVFMCMCTIQLCSKFQLNEHRIPTAYIRIKRYAMVILMGSNHMTLNNPPHCISNQIKLLIFSFITWTILFSRLIAIIINSNRPRTYVLSDQIIFPMQLFKCGGCMRTTWVCDYSSFISSLMNMWIH